MDLLPYDQFARLQLRDFDSSATDARELGGSACFEFRGLHWFAESRRGVEFLRHEDDPKGLGGICLDFRYMASELVASILAAAHLQLRPGMTVEQVADLLGVSSGGTEAAPGYTVHDFECGASALYHIRCYFPNGEGLHGVDIIRQDLLQNNDHDTHALQPGHRVTVAIPASGGPGR